MQTNRRLIHRQLSKFAEQSFQATSTFTHFTWILIQTEFNFNIALKAKDRMQHASVVIVKKSMINFNSNEHFEQTSGPFFLHMFGCNSFR